MPQRIRIAATDLVPPGSAVELIAEGRVVALFNVDGTYHALDGVCPHAGGPLGNGTLEGCIITCPWHGWQFDVTTGQHCLTETIRHTSFPGIVEGDDVFVELP